MKVAGIIAEYNPFHLGHKFHLDSAKDITKCDAVIAVISGNYVQRGEPSLVNKWLKTKMALHNGVDLVLELPIAYSLASAEAFAFGAVSLLHELGVINYLCFGCESGDYNIMFKVASTLVSEPEKYKTSLQLFLKQGMSYASAREKALKEYFTLKEPICDLEQLNVILTSSNCILGIEYIKALIKLHSQIQPYIIKRTGNPYNCNKLGEISSATAIRKTLYESHRDICSIEKHVPFSTYDILKSTSKESFIFSQHMMPYLKYKAIHEAIIGIPGASEGLENKIHKNILNCDTYYDVVENSKSKRYTTTRIQRILCNYFIGTKKGINFNLYDLQKKPCPYARVLGFNHIGRKLLSDIKNKSSIPLVTKMPRDPCPMLQLDILGTNAYGLMDKSIRYNEDFYRSPIIIK